jgi:hypothetical protein
MNAAGTETVSIRVDAGRLWAGGLASAVVAALVGLVGVLVASVANVNPVSPSWLIGDALGEGDARRYAGLGFLAALVFAAVLHVLLLVVPRPLLFFHWILGLATVAAATYAFTRPGSLAEQITAAAITAAIGIAIGSLLSGVATWSVRGVERTTAPDAGTGRL